MSRRSSPIIRVSEHSEKQFKWKNAEWESSGYTPNEAYNTFAEYKTYVDYFAAVNKLKTPYKFVQLRITKQKPSIVWTRTKNWWDAPQFMDHIFWAFFKPVSDVLDGQAFTYYALEPKECIRVAKRLRQMGGLVSDSMAAFLIPCECAEYAWNERSNGISDHLHWRPEKVKTQAEIDREAKRDADAKRILEDARPISDERWGEFGKQIRRELDRVAKARRKEV